MSRRPAASGLAGNASR